MLPQQSRAVPERGQEEMGPDVCDTIDAVQDASNFSSSNSSSHRVKAQRVKFSEEVRRERSCVVGYLVSTVTYCMFTSTFLRYLARVPVVQRHADARISLPSDMKHSPKSSLLAAPISPLFSPSFTAASSLVVDGLQLLFRKPSCCISYLFTADGDASVEPWKRHSRKGFSAEG